MKLLICIPSKGRPYQFQKDMVGWLNKIGIDWKVFVEPQEYIHYKLVAGKQNVIMLDKNDMGLGYCCNFYSQYAMDNGYDLLWRIDDDTTSLTSKLIGNNKKGYTTKVCDMMLKDILPDFKKHYNLGAVRFITSKFHLYEWLGQKRKYTHLNHELFCNRIIRPNLENMLDENIKTGEDACLSAMIVESGFNILVYGKAGMSSKINTNEGGFNMMDRAELTKQTHKYIVKKYPKIELRKNNTWFGLDLNVMPYMNKKVLHNNDDLSTLLQ